MLSFAAMIKKRARSRSTEPLPVPDLFVTAVSIDGTSEYVRLTGWVAHATDLSRDVAGPERRIVARLVMPLSTARDLLRGLRRKLPQADA